MFRLGLVVFCLFALDVSIREYCNGDLTDGKADSQTKVSQARFAGSKPVPGLKDPSESRGDQIYIAYDYRVVESENGNNGRSDKHLRWANRGFLQCSS